MSTLNIQQIIFIAACNRNCPITSSHLLVVLMLTTIVKLWQLVLTLCFHMTLSATIIISELWVDVLVKANVWDSICFSNFFPLTQGKSTHKILFVARFITSIMQSALTGIKPKEYDIKYIRFPYIHCLRRPQKCCLSGCWSSCCVRCCW